MQGDIAINRCECVVGKSTVSLVFKWVGSINATTSNRVILLNKMVKRICVGYQQEGIDPPSGKKPTNYGQT